MKFASAFVLIWATNTVATAPPPSPTWTDPQECNDLGIAAAQLIAFDFCPFNAASGTSSSDESNYKAICKDVATGICEGAIYSSVMANGCSMTTSQLLEEQDKCDAQIDSMVGTDDDVTIYIDDAPVYACPFIYAPVCGCDGITYDNDCLAGASGTVVCSEGACEAAVLCPANYAPVCGCDGYTYANECLAEAAGTEKCREGECPVSCPFIYAPVCGCDGITYANDCIAAAAGTYVCSEGECTAAIKNCSDAYDCESCLSNSECKWWQELGYCEQGCGMNGCGASKCAAEFTTCRACLGGAGSTASGQYSWSPCDNTCYDDCMQAPADAPCYKARHHFNPSVGYTPSDCDSIIACARESSEVA